MPACAIRRCGFLPWQHIDWAARILRIENYTLQLPQSGLRQDPRCTQLHCRVKDDELRRLDIKQPCVEALAEHRDRLGDVPSDLVLPGGNHRQPHVAHMPVAGKIPNDRFVEMIKRECATRTRVPLVSVT